MLFMPTFYAFAHNLAMPKRIIHSCIVRPMTSQEFLKLLMDRSKDNPNSLARKSKVTQSTIFRFLAGTAKEPRLGTFEKIARVYGVPVEAFLSEKARKAAVETLGLLDKERRADGKQEEATTMRKNNVVQLKRPPEEILISQYDVGGAMGHGLELRDQPGIIQSWRVNPEWLERNVKAHSSAKNLCIVTGFGDSMQPLFNPGDPLLVDIGVRTVEFDSIYFFRIGNDGYVKRLQRIPTESGLVIRARSENKEAYDPFDITEKMDFEVLGRVLKVWRSQDF